MKNGWQLLRLCRQYPECDFALNYCLSTKEPNKIRFSLQSVGDFDVSAIAKKYGGGGHLNSAGFKGDKNVLISMGWLV